MKSNDSWMLYNVQPHDVEARPWHPRDGNSLALQQAGVAVHSPLIQPQLGDMLVRTPGGEEMQLVREAQFLANYQEKSAES